MPISPERIKEYQEIYKKYYGKEIRYQEAYEQTTALLRLVKVIHEPMTEKEFEIVLERWNETFDVNMIFDDEE